MRVILMVVALTILFGGSESLYHCLNQNVCYCQTSDNQYIDLKPVGEIQFNLTDQMGAFNYRFQICQPFNYSVECTSVYGCQYNALTKNESHDIGSSSPQFSDIYTLKYNGSGHRSSIIQLECDTKEYTFTIVNFTSPDFVFKLQTKYACPQMLTTTVTPSTTDHSNSTHSSTTDHSNSTTTHPNSTVATTTTTHPNSTVTTTSAYSNSTSETTTVITITSATTHIYSTTHNSASIKDFPYDAFLIIYVVSQVVRIWFLCRRS